MKKVLALLLLFSLSSLYGQQEALVLPWSSFDNWNIDWEAADSVKTTWQLSLNDSDTLYYTAFHQTFDLSVEQLARKMVRNIETNYYMARYIIHAKDLKKDAEMEYLLFSIESREYIPTGLPMTSLFMVVLGKERTFILSTDLPTHKLKRSDKKKWVSFFKQAQIESRSMTDMFAWLP